MNSVNSGVPFSSLALGLAVPYADRPLSFPSLPDRWRTRVGTPDRRCVVTLGSAASYILWQGECGEVFTERGIGLLSFKLLTFKARTVQTQICLPLAMKKR